MNLQLILYLTGMMVLPLLQEPKPYYYLLPDNYEGPVLIRLTGEGDTLQAGDTIRIDQQGISEKIYLMLPAQPMHPKNNVYLYRTRDGIVEAGLKDGAQSAHLGGGIIGSGRVVAHDTVARHAEYITTLLYTNEVSLSSTVIEKGKQFRTVIANHNWLLKYRPDKGEEPLRETRLSGDQMLKEIELTADDQQWTLVDALYDLEPGKPRIRNSRYGTIDGYYLLVCHEDKRIGCDQYLSNPKARP